MSLPQVPGRDLPEPRPAAERAGPPPGEPRPQVVVVERPPERRSGLSTLLHVLLVGLLLLSVATLGTVLVVVASFAGITDRIGNSVGGVGDVVERAGEGVRSTTRDVLDRFDPAHPPRQALALDTEFDALRVVRVGDEVGRTEEYVLTLREIRRRGGADSPDVAQYAVVHREYVTPKKTTVFGVTVRVDRGEADYYLYKGESFRLGDEFYKVNWVSIDDQAMAVARYRHADTLTAPLKFQVD